MYIIAGQLIDQSHYYPYYDERMKYLRYPKPNVAAVAPPKPLVESPLVMSGGVKSMAN